MSVSVAGWALDDRGETFDPGVYLGGLGPFPFGSAAPADAVPSRVFVGLDDASRALAVQFLAYLFDGMVQGRPVLVTASTHLLAQGPALDALVAALAWARAGLPARLRSRCRLRVPSAMPERFLGTDRAHLLVIPADLTSRALTVCREAVIIDRRGDLLVGTEPTPTATAYAAAVGEAAARFPQGLTAFGERFDRLWNGDLPLAAHRVALIPVVFNLGVALHGSTQQRANLFSNFLIDRARRAELPWAELVSDDEWRSFPEDCLAAYLLRPPKGLVPGELALQSAIERAFRAGSVRIDPGVQVWWDAQDGAKRGRLLELSAGMSPLVSAALVADLCDGLSLAALSADGPITGVLAAELEAGTLGERETEVAAMLVQSADPEILAVLSKATRCGIIGPAWIDPLIAAADPWTLGRVLLNLVAAPADLGRWGEVPERLIGAVRLAAPIDPEWVQALARAAEGIDPAIAPNLYLDVLDLVRRAEPAPGARFGPLLARFWAASDSGLDSMARRQVVADLLGGRWSCLVPGDLLDAQGALRPAWLHSLPDLVLANAELRAAMLLADLIRMRPGQASDPALWVSALTAHWQRDPPGVTDALVAADSWYEWRRRADLDPGQGRCAALLWLASPLWVHHRGAGPEGLPPHWHRRKGRDPRHRPPECTWEAWGQAMADLATGLMAQDVRTVSAPQTHWPWIYPFEQEQIADLQSRCQDEDARNALGRAASVG